MTRDSTDSRQDSILHAASHAFATYGYRKTSMNDIADGAGMSRPAVYLHYKNKDDIFRQLVQIYYDHAAIGLALVFDAGKPVVETLQDAFDAQMGDVVETLLSSPHGMDLLDTGYKTAADIKETGEARLRDLYADWLHREAEAGKIQLPDTPEQVANVIQIALKGLKMSGTDIAGLRSGLATLATITGKGLQAN